MICYLHLLQFVTLVIACGDLNAFDLIASCLHRFPPFQENNGNSEKNGTHRKVSLFLVMIPFLAEPCPGAKNVKLSDIKQSTALLGPSLVFIMSVVASTLSPSKHPQAFDALELLVCSPYSASDLPIMQRPDYNIFTS